MSQNRNTIDFEILWKKFHQKLSEEENQLLEAWLKEDEQHQHFFESAQSFYTKGSQFGNHPEEVKRSWEKINRATGGQKWILSRFITIGSVAAASIAIVISLFLFTNRQIDSSLSVAPAIGDIQPGSDKAMLILHDGSTYQLSENKDITLTEGNSVIKNTGEKLEYLANGKKTKEIRYNTLQIPRGGEFSLQLSDGTKVWLNSETILRYPVQFGKTERRVELSGEAYFEVAKNAKAPFYVISGSQTVKVLGTQFNISAYHESPVIATTLVEGKIEIFESEQPRNKEFLLPNQQSQFSKKDKHIFTRNVNAETYVAWKNGRFVFENEPLSSIMQTLSRWYNTEYIFVNADRKNMCFTGNLQRYSNIQDLLQKIAKTNEVKFNINNNKIIIE